MDERSTRFVELEVLELTDNSSYEWKEQARWIKLEEDIEVCSGRWSRPYVPTLSYSAIKNYKKFQEQGHVILDLEVSTLEEISSVVCNLLVEQNIIEDGFLPILQATLLTRHHHQNQKTQGGDSLHEEVRCEIPCMKNTNTLDSIESKCRTQQAEHLTVTFLKDYENTQVKYKEQDILDCMSDNAEAATILVANVSYTKKTVVIFIRLKCGTLLGNLNEISIPVRFLFFVIGPESKYSECYQVGRTIGTLMSDELFGKVASECQTKRALISGIQSFLVNSTVLPFGDWSPRVLHQSISKWTESMTFTEYNDTHKRKETICAPLDSELLPMEQPKRDDDPLRRTGRLFGGLVRDIKRKIPHIKSDYVDAVNFHCLISVIFVYFSFLAPAVTFAVLLSEETGGLLGVSEMIVATTVSGIIFGLFAGQPLIILGATSPLLIMEESIYQLSTKLHVEFLPWRVWIGLWITVFCTLIVAFDLSFLVRKFTLFTEEVVTALISMVFIHESLRYIYAMFGRYYFPIINEENDETAPPVNSNHTNVGNLTTFHQEPLYRKKHQLAIPFMTMILMIGTFLTCYCIRKLRHSKYFPSKLRRLLSDFGISLAVLLFLLFDKLMKDEYTPKVNIPDGFTPTSPTKRGWLIEILGTPGEELSTLAMIGACIPAFLVTIILFMETELTGTILDRKEYKLKKGSGYNLDLLVVGLLASLCSIFGLPWMCACPVHSISHLNSLTIWNRNTAPGTRPTVKKVIEQRVTNILIHILIGLSVFLAPLLRNIPVSVLVGILLYLGITSLSHLKFTQRIRLLFVQAKNHPDQYIRKLKTHKVHLFTCIQLICLVVIVTVKNSILAPLFPFFIVLMVPLRHLLRKVFTDEELEELDSDNEDLNDDNLDEYDVVHVPM